MKVIAKDAAGNQSSDEIEIYYDPDMLSIIIQSPTEEDYYIIENSKITISGIANAKNQIEKVNYAVSAQDETVYSTGEATGTTNWSISDLTLNPGVSTLHVAVTDDLQTTTSDSILILNTVDNDQDFLPDFQEPEYGTNPNLKDTDGDGLTDGIEVIYGLNPLDSTDAQGDLDNDGLSNINEQNLNTSLLDPDTDSDGLLDGEEVTKNTNPLESDSDHDKLKDGDEITFGTDPTNPDTDGDGILDGDELFEVPLSNIIDGTGKEQKVIPSVSIRGDLASTTMIENIEGIYANLSSDSPGYLGAPYEFTTEGEFDEAVMTFTYDKSLDTGGDFEPAIYYFNEATGQLELVPNQTVNRELGTVSATVNHFSIYLLLNKKKWEEAWSQEILRPRPGDGETEVEYVDIVFAIDSSGSMDWNDPRDLRKTAVINFINTLLVQDRGAIVDFDSSAKVTVHLTTQHQELVVAVNAIDASGGTNLNNGLTAAINELVTNGQNSTKYIIFLTDGDGTFTESTLQPAVANNIKIYTVGLGSGVRETTLKKIASVTGGKYFFASTADDLIDQFEKVSDETTGPKYEDSDNDGISDYEEVHGIRLIDGKIIFTDPNNPDTDGDGINDGDELGSYVDVADNTKSAFSLMAVSSKATKQGGSYYYKSQPDKSDTDGDGYNDREDEYPKIFHYKLGSQGWADKVEEKMENYKKNPNYEPEKVVLWEMMKETKEFKKELVTIKKDYVDNSYNDPAFRTFYTKFNGFVGMMNPTGITKEIHYFRNVLGEDIAPETLDELIKLNKKLIYNNKWDMLPVDMAAFHMNGPDGIYNTKFVLGTDQYFEAVYSKNGSLLSEKTNPVNMGTYNYFGPENAKKHKAFDVDPYFQWDNSKELSRDFLYADGLVYYSSQALMNINRHYGSHKAQLYYDQIELQI